MAADQDAQTATGATGHGHGDTHGRGHNVRAGNWVAVVLIVVGAIVLGFALPTRSMVLGVVGGIVLALGAVAAIVFRIFDDAY